MTKVLKATLLAASLCTSTAFLVPASATDLFTSGTFSCTTIDCGSTTLNGSVNVYRASASGEHVLKFFAGSNECLRLHVISQDADLEMNVIAPNPSTRFRDDDGGEGLEPLVVVNGTQRGWYTVVLHHFAGSAVNSNFTIRVGRYVLNNNPNCSLPTAPSSAVSSSKART
jgi:hypothetical protein